MVNGSSTPSRPTLAYFGSKSREPAETSLPAASWQTFDITLIGRDVTVVLNGKTTIDKQEIEGLTAIATDTKENKPGPITLQGDHGPVAFRSIVVTPLVRQDARPAGSVELEIDGDGGPGGPTRHAWSRAPRQGGGSGERRVANLRFLSCR